MKAAAPATIDNKTPIAEALFANVNFITIPMMILAKSALKKESTISLVPSRPIRFFRIE